MPEPAFPYPAFVRFSRPHTVIGTTLSIAVVTLLAVLERRTADPHTSQVAAAATLALATALPMNIYIVGASVQCLRCDACMLPALRILLSCS